MARNGFQLDRARLGEWVIGVAAVALLVDLIAVPWYSVHTSVATTSAGFGVARSATGLQADHLLGALAILCAVLGIGTWCVQVTRRGPALGVCMTVIASLVTLVLSVGLLIRVGFDPPQGLRLRVAGAAAIRTDLGAVLGLVLAWVIYAGTWISLRADGIAEADAPQRIETLSLNQPVA